MGKGDCTYRLPCFAPNSSHRRCCSRSSQAAGTTDRETFTITASVPELPQSKLSRNNTPSRLQQTTSPSDTGSAWQVKKGNGLGVRSVDSFPWCVVGSCRGGVRVVTAAATRRTLRALLLLGGHIPGLRPRLSEKV